MQILDFGLRILDCGCKRRRAEAAPVSRVPRALIQNPKSKIQNPPLRSGISLLEVLISMFVLLFGLMGVAAIFPVGNHYAGKGDQYDRAAVMSEMAFAELKSRGMMLPVNWYYAGPLPSGSRSQFNQVILQNSSPTQGEFSVISANGPGYAFFIDPMGAAAAVGVANRDIFPLIDCSQAPGRGATVAVNTDMPTSWRKQAAGDPAGLAGDRWPIRRLTLAQRSGVPMTTAVAETIFNLHDDVTVELPEESDHPGIQRWTSDRTGKPLARQYTGNYSWLATVVPVSPAGRDALQPSSRQYGQHSYDVSVAVFYKRQATPGIDTERAITAQLQLGGELEMYAPSADLVDAAVKDLRPGQWIALAGVIPGTEQFVLKWYRLLSLDDETASENLPPVGTVAVRRAMLEGPDWPAPAPTATATTPVVTDLRAILLPGVIGVSTQTLPMEGPTSSRSGLLYRGPGNFGTEPFVDNK